MKNVDVKLILGKVIKRWYLFVFFLPIAFIAARYYTQYQTKLYLVESTLQINSEGTDAEDALMAELKPGKVLKKSMADQIAILKSYGLTKRTLKNTDFYIDYYHKGDYLSYNLYNHSPFSIKLDSNNSIVPKGHFVIEPKDSYTFTLKANVKENAILNFKRDTTIGYCSKNLNGKFFYGQPIQLDSTHSFTVVLNNPNWKKIETIQHSFTFNSLENLIYRYENAPLINSGDGKSSMINLSMRNANSDIAIDYLNTLMQEYVKMDYENKVRAINNSLNFIKKQIAETQDKLSKKENELQNLRDDSKIYNIEMVSDNTYNALLELEEQKENFLLQRKYYDLVIEYIEKHKDFSDLIAPSTLGIDDALVTSVVGELKTMYQQRASREFTITEKNPTYEILNREQKQTVEIALENLRQGIKRIDFEINSINNRIEDNYAMLKQIPKEELNHVRVQREIDGLKRLLDFLVEKEATLGISASRVTSDHQIIDLARLSKPGPVYPQPQKILTNFLIGALALIAAIIFLLDFLVMKIENKEQIQNIVDWPFLGNITHAKSKSKLAALENPKSLIAESFRTLRVNLSYLNPDHKDCFVVGITSTTSGEGKTFCASNLAGMYALNGKKTILIGADMRKPRLERTFETESTIGLSNFLIGEASLEESIQQSDRENLDILFSGPVPPNPAEMLGSKKMTELLNTLRETYDVVIIDSSPVGLVTDYMVLEKYTDVTVYVVRQNYTRFSNFNLTQDLKLKHPAIVLNDFTKSFANYNGYGYGYGYGYHYGYYSEEKNTGKLKKLLRRFKKK